jgi:hypothetical protein
MLSAPALRDRHVLWVGCAVEAVLRGVTSPT